MVLHKAQHTFVAPLGYINVVLHPRHTNCSCISLIPSSRKNTHTIASKSLLYSQKKEEKATFLIRNTKKSDTETCAAKSIEVTE